MAHVHAAQLPSPVTRNFRNNFPFCACVSTRETHSPDDCLSLSLPPSLPPPPPRSTTPGIYPPPLLLPPGNVATSPHLILSPPLSGNLETKEGARFGSKAQRDRRRPTDRPPRPAPASLFHPDSSKMAALAAAARPSLLACLPSFGSPHRQARSGRTRVCDSTRTRRGAHAHVHASHGVWRTPPPPPQPRPRI